MGQIDKWHKKMVQTDKHNTGMLVRAIYWLLKPLVKLCIEKGLSYPQLRDLLKALYVEVANQEFALLQQRPSDSRIFILTGVHRKDVKRLRSQTELVSEASKTTSLGGELVAHWTAMNEFIDDQGNPKVLSRTSVEGEPGFDALLSHVSKDIRPRVVIDEWLRLGVVTITQENKIQLNQSAFIPQEGFAEKAWYLGKNVHDHLAACCHNLIAPSAKPMLERSVYYSSLSPQSIKQLQVSASQQANTLLQSLNQQALQLQQADQNNPQAHFRMRFGTYWFEENTRASEKAE